jgi:very-short-patch-repair endonuclease
VPHIYTRTSEKALRQSLRAEMPSAESVLWSKLRRRQLLGYKFRRQYSVGAYVVDFYCAELRLAIELDGDTHFQGRAHSRDKERERFIKSFGIDFLRFRNVEVFEQLNEVLEAIARKLLEAPKPPCSPPLSKGGRFSLAMTEKNP